MEEIDAPKAIIVLGILMYAFIVVALAWTGITGLRGKPIWMPHRSGGVSMQVTGRAARVAGAVCLLLALFLVFLFVRGVEFS